MESTIKYLWKAASLLPSTKNLYHKIGSNLLNNALTGSQYTYRLNAGLVGSHVRCQYCHTEWKHNKYSYTVLKQKKIKKRTKRKYKIIAENVRGCEKEKDIVKAKERLHGKIMMIKCSLCDMTTKHVLMKDNNKYKYQNSKLHNTTMKASKSIIDDNKNVSIRTPNNNKTFQNRKNIKSNSFRTLQSREQKRKLQELCYRSTAMKPSVSSPNTAQNASSFNNNNMIDTSLNTPGGLTKKRRQRDKYAGLFKEACMSASTPKQKNNLQLLLKERDSK